MESDGYASRLRCFSPCPKRYPSSAHTSGSSRASLASARQGMFAVVSIQGSVRSVPSPHFSSVVEERANGSNAAQTIFHTYESGSSGAGDGDEIGSRYKA